MKISNREWSDKLIFKIDPGFRHRWAVYEEAIANLIDSSKVWIDCGCGNNNLVKELGHLAKAAYGIDLTEINQPDKNFIKADIKYIPLLSCSADLVTLRFVAEHFNNPGEYFTEITRVLKKNGRILIITTNVNSPVIFLPKFVFPFSLKNKILSKVFQINTKDIFPTYHKMNSSKKFKNLNKGLKVTEVKFISDLNYTRKWVFMILFGWHFLTKLFRLENLRTNLLVILEKTG